MVTLVKVEDPFNLNYLISQAVGGFFFLMTSWYVLDDKAKADRAISEAEAVASQSNHQVSKLLFF